MKTEDILRRRVNLLTRVKKVLETQLAQGQEWRNTYRSALVKVLRWTKDHLSTSSDESGEISCWISGSGDFLIEALDEAGFNLSADGGLSIPMPEMSWHLEECSICDRQTGDSNSWTLNQHDEWVCNHCQETEELRHEVARLTAAIDLQNLAQWLQERDLQNVTRDE